MYPDALSWGLDMCVHMDWDRHKKDQGKMNPYRHLIETWARRTGHQIL